MSAPQIAAVLPMTRQTVRNLARRYQQGGLEGALYDKQRRGAYAFGPTMPAHHRDGLQQPSAGACPLDGAAGGHPTRPLFHVRVVSNMAVVQMLLHRGRGSDTLSAPGRPKGNSG